MSQLSVVANGNVWRCGSRIGDMCQKLTKDQQCADAQASVPPPSWYTAADAFAIEQERVFRKTWQAQPQYRATMHQTPDSMDSAELVRKAAARHCRRWARLISRMRTWLGACRRR